jgi:hypothetical protein
VFEPEPEPVEGSVDGLVEGSVEGVEASPSVEGVVEEGLVLGSTVPLAVGFGILDLVLGYFNKYGHR